MQKIALITGANGQDGSYLSELLLEKGYYVLGLVRRSSTNTHERISHLKYNSNFKLLEGDITDPNSINPIFTEYNIDECYNLAAMSHVGSSFKQPSLSIQVNTIGVLNLLEAIKTLSPETRFYQASTSEMFGKNFTTSKNKGHDPYSMFFLESKHYQDENTPFCPQSPYAVSKVAAHNLVQLYRDSYEMHASSGILFNHESPRRGEEFVTRKITKWIGQKKKYHTIDNLKLGNLDAYRDWGYAKDYVEAMWLMLQQEIPDDYVISTGETHSVREFLAEAFYYAGLGDWENFVDIDPSLIRPAEVDYLCGHSKKAKEKLGWKPKTTFKQLVMLMVDHDISQA